MQTENEEKQRVQKIIASRGFCSRRRAEEYIIEGLVRVNGKPVKIGDSCLETDIIVVDGIKLKPQNQVYIMLNKPRGYECSLHPDTKSVLKLVPLKERIYPVGRLDKGSTGLLLLTNDGEFANKVMHPSKGIFKVYLVELDNPLEEKHIEKLHKGVRLVDGKVFPRVEKIDDLHYKVSIQEGRKHIIKRMLFKMGFFVKKLTRVQIGKLQLNVKEGNWRYLDEKDIERVFA